MKKSLLGIILALVIMTLTSCSITNKNDITSKIFNSFGDYTFKMEKHKTDNGFSFLLPEGSYILPDNLLPSDNDVYSKCFSIGLYDEDDRPINILGTQDIEDFEEICDGDGYKAYGLIIQGKRDAVNNAAFRILNDGYADPYASFNEMLEDEFLDAYYDEDTGCYDEDALYHDYGASADEIRENIDCVDFLLMDDWYWDLKSFINKDGQPHFSQEPSQEPNIPMSANWINDGHIMAYECNDSGDIYIVKRVDEGDEVKALLGFYSTNPNDGQDPNNHDLPAKLEYTAKMFK